MEKTVFEDQPKPEDVPVAVAGPVLSEATKRLQPTIQELANTLTRKLQLNGGAMNLLEFELKIFLLVEHMQVFSSLLIELSAGKYTDDSITDMMNARVQALTQQIESSLKAPMLARGALQAMNGSKHN